MPLNAKRERRKEARPGELLAAALDLFVEKGFAATRAEEIAAHAGVSKGTLFLYFPSKEELFKAVVTENLGGHLNEWNREFDSYEGSTADMLRYCMRIWWERVGATKASGLTKLMMSEGKNFPELAAFYRREVVLPAHELVRRILQRGIDRTEFAPMNIDLTIYAIMAPMILLMLMQHTPAICCDPESANSPEKYLATQAETILHGLSLRPPAAA